MPKTPTPPEENPITAAREAAQNYATLMGPQTQIVAPHRVYGNTFETGQKQRDALQRLAALRDLREAVEAEIRSEVATARKNTRQEFYPNNASWIEVGAALGVTKQSAQARYGK